MFIIFKTGNIGRLLTNQALTPFQKVRLAVRFQIVREDCISYYVALPTATRYYVATLSDTFTHTLTSIDTYAIMNAVHGVDLQGEGSADAHFIRESSMRLTRAAMQPTNFSREFPRICYYKQRNSSYEN